MVHSHPDRVAHEIYTAEALCAHERDEEVNKEGEGCSLEPSHVLTYGELNRKANAIARWLLSSTSCSPSSENGKIDQEKAIFGEKGVKGEKICVCMEREAAFYVIMAAIWKAGGVYCSVGHLSHLIIQKSYGVEMLFRLIPRFRQRGRDTLCRIVARNWYSCIRLRSVKFISMIFPLISRVSYHEKILWAILTAGAVTVAPLVLILADEYDLDQCGPVRSSNRDAFGAASTQENLETDVQEAELDDVSYLLYTSGECLNKRHFHSLYFDSYQ